MANFAAGPAVTVMLAVAEVRPKLEAVITYVPTAVAENVDVAMPLLKAEIAPNVTVAEGLDARANTLVAFNTLLLN